MSAKLRIAALPKRLVLPSESKSYRAEFALNCDVASEIVTALADIEDGMIGEGSSSHINSFSLSSEKSEYSHHFR